MPGERTPPKGLHIAGKAAIVDVSRSWLAKSPAATVGDVGSFGGHAWLLFIDVNGQTVVLNADTTRAAVDTFVHDTVRTSSARGGSSRTVAPASTRCSQARNEIRCLAGIPT